MTAIEEARAALELVVKWEGREVAWDTPRARDLNTVATALRALIAEYERLSVPPSDDEREALAELRLAAEAQRDAYARMLELGQGVGMLGVRHPEMFEAMLAWDDRSENGHADTVLDLIDRLNAALRRQEPITDDEREVQAQTALDSERLRQIAEWLRMDHGLVETAKRVDLIADRHDRLAAGFRQQGPITDEAVDAAHEAWQTAPREVYGKALVRHMLEAAERARSAVPSTTEPTEQEKP